MGEMGLIIKVKGGPQLGSWCEGQREKNPESNKAERRRAGEELAGTLILGASLFLLPEKMKTKLINQCPSPNGSSQCLNPFS